MKIVLGAICLLPLGVFALEPTDLHQKLEVAASAEGQAYIEARTAITESDGAALPGLFQASDDPALTWQQRLVARICHERMVQGKNLAELRGYDWRQHPGYDPDWENSLAGPGWKMQPLVISHLAKVGLWYYYVEIIWKQTGELAISPLRDINDHWLRWCRRALAGEPEEEYLFLAMAERIEKDERLEAPDAVELYVALCDAKRADAIPVLVQRYEAYNKREVIGPEVFSGSHTKTYRGMFRPILAMADSRHADLLEVFMARHEALAELQSVLAEVRARPAGTPKADPPFRPGPSR